MSLTHAPSQYPAPQPSGGHGVPARKHAVAARSSEAGPFCPRRQQTACFPPSASHSPATSSPAPQPTAPWDHGLLGATALVTVAVAFRCATVSTVARRHLALLPVLPLPKHECVAPSRARRAMVALAAAAATVLAGLDPVGLAAAPLGCAMPAMVPTGAQLGRHTAAVAPHHLPLPSHAHCHSGQTTARVVPVAVVHSCARACRWCLPPTVGSVRHPWLKSGRVMVVLQKHAVARGVSTHSGAPGVPAQEPRALRLGVAPRAAALASVSRRQAPTALPQVRNRAAPLRATVMTVCPPAPTALCHSGVPGVRAASRVGTGFGLAHDRWSSQPRVAVRLVALLWTLHCVPMWHVQMVAMMGLAVAQVVPALIAGRALLAR